MWDQVIPSPTRSLFPTRRCAPPSTTGRRARSRHGPPLPSFEAELGRALALTYVQAAGVYCHRSEHDVPGAVRLASSNFAGIYPAFAMLGPEGMAAFRATVAGGQEVFDEAKAAAEDRTAHALAVEQDEQALIQMVQRAIRKGKFG